MPVMDGIEATKRIRALESEVVQPYMIVALSADATTDCVQTCTEIGVSGYLTKPLMENELLVRAARRIDK